MRILFTGGGTGGHFYPIIAVAQELRDIIYKEKLVNAELYFASTNPYNEKLLEENEITFIKIPSDKFRNYFSLKNILSPFVIFWGIIKAIWKLYIIYPDVVFSKGGYASVPTLWAARILRIPVIIHDSDALPGRTSRWSAKFAVRIALSHSEAARFFPEHKTAVTGNPVRREMLHPIKEGAHEFLKLREDIPIILVLGGSQGAARINEVILALLPDILNNYQIIHQTGKDHYEGIAGRAGLTLSDSEHKERYRAFPYLNDIALRMAAGASSLIISRAGSTIFEIAHWELPSIILPIPEPISHDQTKNAFAYAHHGACSVITDSNLTPSVLHSEIDRILTDPELQEKMKAGARSFATPEAGKNIAEELLTFGLQHEQ